MGRRMIDRKDWRIFMRRYGRTELTGRWLFPGRGFSRTVPNPQIFAESLFYDPGRASFFREGRGSKRGFQFRWEANFCAGEILAGHLKNVARALKFEPGPGLLKPFPP